MTPPWRLQDLGDQLLGRNTRPSPAEWFPKDPGPLQFAVPMEGYDTAWWVALEPPGGRPVVFIWRMKTHPNEHN